MDLTPKKAMETLRGGVWHVTSCDFFEGIKEAGAIQVEPDIPERSRYGGRSGPAKRPYVRHIGGVSLFDFRKYDLKRFDQEFPSNTGTIRYYVPFYRREHDSVWIQIDPVQAGKSLLSPAELNRRRDVDGERSRLLIPRIEACHIGDIPKDRFLRVLFARHGISSFV